MNEENDRKIKIIIKINNVLIKILLIFVCFLACSSLFHKNEVFAMDNVERKLWQKYSFKRMPNFIVPRSEGATATVLKDGRVLFTGGIFSPLNSTNSAEIYDPVKNVFIKLPNMNESRTLHSAVLLSNGDVLISGGEKYERGKGFVFLKSAEIYKTKENKFVKINDMQEVMSSHKMYMLPNADIVVLQNPNEIEIFDAKKNTFTKMKGIPYIKGPVCKFVELNENEILMYPYHYEQGKTSLVVFNTKNLSLKKLDINPFQNIKYNTNLSANTINQLKNERSSYNIAKVSDSEILVSGGEGGYLNGSRSSQIIKIDIGQEITTPVIPEPGRFFHSSIPICKNIVLIMGGETGADYSLRTLNSTLFYIKEKNKFVNFKKMLYKRFLPSFVKLNDGNYIIWGGCDVFGKPYPPEMLVVKNK